MFPLRWGAVLHGLVSGRATVLITGGTGTGKTTLLKALLAECSQRERIVSVEETRELGGLPHGDHVSMVVREANIEGRGAIGLAELVKATLRMRPDRVVLGECRGEEIADLLRALNSGHHGGMTTLHADSVDRVPSRLQTLGLLAGLDPAALSMLAEGAFDVVIHLERRNGRRRIAQIGVLQVDREQRLIGRILAEWDGEREPRCHDGWDAFVRRWALHGGAAGAAAGAAGIGTAGIAAPGVVHARHGSVRGAGAGAGAVGGVGYGGRGMVGPDCPTAVIAAASAMGLSESKWNGWR